MSYGNVTIVNSAYKILSSNTKRKSFWISNDSPYDIWVGNDNSVTAGTAPNSGLKVDSGVAFGEGDGGNRMYLGDIWGITNTATAAAVSFWERE